MMDQVLHDYPKSAKAHYVAAEVDEASGNFVLGRQELRLAQELAPGLPFAAPESVRELKDKVSRTQLAHTPLTGQTAAAFPWSEQRPLQAYFRARVAAQASRAILRVDWLPVNDPLGEPDFGLSGARSWDDDDQVKSSDDWI